MKNWYKLYIFYSLIKIYNKESFCLIQKNILSRNFCQVKHSIKTHKVYRREKYDWSNQVIISMDFNTIRDWPISWKTSLFGTVIWIWCESFDFSCKVFKALFIEIIIIFQLYFLLICSIKYLKTIYNEKSKNQQNNPAKVCR